MVGYRISPVLWKRSNVDWSRSCTVRWHCVSLQTGRRNQCIYSEEYWSLDAVAFKILGKRNRWLQSSTERKREDDDFFQRRSGKDHERTGRCILSGQRGEKRERSKKAPLPFTTSTLQQEASKALNFSTQKTMRLAQQLYEGGISKRQGTVALISYLRTDSTRISEEADAMARSFIGEHYGEKLCGSSGEQNRKKTRTYRMHMRQSVRPMSPACRRL